MNLLRFRLPMERVPLLACPAVGAGYPLRTAGQASSSTQILTSTIQKSLDRPKMQRGMTLVELLVIISACSIILTTSATLMHRVMHTQKKTRAFFDVERSAARLSDQFRRDAHQASGATINSDAAADEPFLTLQFPSGQTIAYRRTSGDVLRVLSREGQATSREQYSFPAHAELTIREAESPRRLILSIATARNTLPRDERGRSLDPHAMPVAVQIEALLDRGPQVVVEEVPQ